MLDQNTTTVLTTLITVGGTLGGVVLGVVLSNRYVARQEKAKRNTAVIEEVFTLVMKIYNKCLDNIDNQQLFDEDTFDSLDRTYTLIALYLPPLMVKFNLFHQHLSRLVGEIEKMEPEKKENRDTLLRNRPPSWDNYFSSYTHLVAGLIELVK